MYYRMCQVQAIMPGNVPVRKLGLPNRVSQNIRIGNKMGTIGHYPFQKVMGIWILHNGHVDFV
jgi:hypothetical protein